MISQFLELPDLTFISDGKEFHQYELGYGIRFYEEEVYDFSTFNVAILGVKESRAAGMKNLGSDLAPDEVRKQLYRLNTGQSFPKILDLGNILDAETVSETYEYLEGVLNYLYKNEVTVIIIGGSQDLTYSQYISFENVQDSLSMLVVDERIDLVQNQDQVTSDAYLQHILTCPHPQLFHLSLFGVQSFFTNHAVMDVLDSMSYNCIRLAAARYNVQNFQHVFRMSDLVSIDVSVVKQSDAPGRSMQSPNGFLSDEFCQIARYSGMSDKVKSFGIFELNPQLDIRYQTTQLTAQAIWYFLEGYSYRTAEHPVDSESSDNFSIFMVEMPEFSAKSFNFWYSKLTNQWWVEFPLNQENPDRFQPCSKADYESAAQGEMSSWVFNLMSKLM